MKLDKSYEAEYSPKRVSRKCITPGCPTMTLYADGVCGFCGGEGREIQPVQDDLFGKPEEDSERGEDDAT